MAVPVEGPAGRPQGNQATTPPAPERTAAGAVAAARSSTISWGRMAAGEDWAVRMAEVAAGAPAAVVDSRGRMGPRAPRSTGRGRQERVAVERSPWAPSTARRYSQAPFSM